MVEVDIERDTGKSAPPGTETALHFEH
jgi:hypothetical protein